MALKIAKPSEASPSFQERLAGFFREHGWLCAGTFAAVIVATAEGRRPEAEELAAQRTAIAALSADEQQRLQLQAVAFRQLTAEQQATIQSVHHEVVAHPELSDTLAEYHKWLESLPKGKRDQILAESDHQKRLSLIREAREPAKQEPTPRSNDGPNSRRPGFFAGSNEFLNRMPLQASASQNFDLILKALAKEVGAPDAPKAANDLERWEYRLRVVDRALMDLPRDGQRSIRDVVRKVFENKLPPDARDKLPSDFKMATELLFKRLVFEGMTLMEKDGKYREQFMNDLPPNARLHFSEMPDKQRDLHITVSHIRKVAPDLGSQIFETIIEDPQRPRPDRPGNRGDDLGPDGGPLGRGPRGNGPRPNGQRPGGGFGGGFGGQFDGPPPDGRPNDEPPPRRREGL